MYGYFRPDYAKLSKREHEVFNAYYCRLCYCLRRLGGQAARFFTSYDGAVYSIILNLFMKAPQPPFLSCQRFKKENMLKFDGDEIGRAMACISALAVSEKIDDDIADENSFKAKIGAKFFRKVFERARAEYPEVAAILHDGIKKVDDMQRAGEDFDDITDVYGNMLQASFCELAPLDDRFKKLYIDLARWIFFIDALCDYDEDVKKRRYNPFAASGCATITEYFDRNYFYITEYARKMNSALVSSLVAVDDGSVEYRAVYKVVNYAVGTVSEKIAAV